MFEAKPSPPECLSPLEVALNERDDARAEVEKLKRAISGYRIAALQSVMHDEMLHEIVKGALDAADKATR